MQVRYSSLKRASQHFRTSRKWAQSSSVGVAAQIGWVGIPVGLTAGLYWESPKLEAFFLVIMLAALVLFAISDGVRMRPTDWNILLIAAFEVPSLLFSQYRANSIRTADAILTAVTVYFAIRITIRNSLQFAFLSGAFALGGAWIGLSGLLQFAESARILRESGFLNLVAFRSRLILPSGSWIVGEWFTVVLLTLPFACALSAYLWLRRLTWPAALSTVAPVIISATLIASLSRAVFLSTMLFFLIACAFMAITRVINIQTSAILLGWSIFALVLILLCESATFPGILKAYRNQQTSQARSTEGRIAIWQRSLPLILAHPLWGIGSSNVALALSSTADQEDTVGFASRTFSLPLQVLLEKGLVGFSIYATFVVLVGRQFVQAARVPFWRPHDSRRGEPACTVHRYSDRRVPNGYVDRSGRNAMVSCFAAGLLAVLARRTKPQKALIRK